jgi:hypothetical protein
MDDVVIVRKVAGSSWWAVLVAGREVYSSSNIDGCIQHIEMWGQRPASVTVSLLTLEELIPRTTARFFPIFRSSDEPSEQQ